MAPVDWLVHGQNAVELYSLQCRKTSLSHDKLLFGCAQEAVSALAGLTLNEKENLKYIKWSSACGKDGVLTKAIKVMILSYFSSLITIHSTYLESFIALWLTFII